MSVPPNPLAVPGSRDLTLADVGPGWALASTRRYVNTDPEPELRDPVAGICVEVIHDTITDPDTGEIWPRTRYRCLATWRPDPFRWPTLDATEIALDSELRLDRLRAWNCFCWLVRPIVTSKRRQPNATDVQALTDAWRLLRAIV